MPKLNKFLVAFIFLIVAVSGGRAQNKLLTIDDIFDPARQVRFGGSTPAIRWMKDGRHYLLTNDAARRDVPRLQKVDAVTGTAEPFFDAAKMQAAFTALPEYPLSRLANYRIAARTG